jgi:hypothetical protein
VKSLEIYAFKDFLQKTVAKPQSDSSLFKLTSNLLLSIMALSAADLSTP